MQLMALIHWQDNIETAIFLFRELAVMFVLYCPCWSESPLMYMLTEFLTVQLYTSVQHYVWLCALWFQYFFKIKSLNGFFWKCNSPYAFCVSCHYKYKAAFEETQQVPVQNNIWTMFGWVSLKIHISWWLWHLSAFYLYKTYSYF